MGTKISEATLREILKGSESLPIVDTDLPKGRTTTQILKDYCATPIGEAEGTAFDGARGKAVEDIVNNIKNERIATRIKRNDIFGRDVNNLTIEFVVPSTGGESSYDVQFKAATTELAGLMSTADKRKVDKVIINGDGTTFLSDNGTYKAIEIPDISNLATKDEVNAKLSTETYNADKATFATKTELNKKVSTDTYNADKATFATKAELGTKLDTSTYNSDKKSFATKTELGTKVSGTGVTKMQVVTELPESPDASTLYILTAPEETA